jgi:hypothetical protein
MRDRELAKRLRACGATITDEEMRDPARLQRALNSIRASIMACSRVLNNTVRFGLGSDTEISRLLNTEASTAFPSLELITRYIEYGGQVSNKTLSLFCANRLSKQEKKILNLLLTSANVDEIEIPASLVNTKGAHIINQYIDQYNANAEAGRHVIDRVFHGESDDFGYTGPNEEYPGLFGPAGLVSQYYKKL